MGTLFAILTRSAVRLVATLGVVILILLAGHWLKSEWANLDVSTVTLAQLKGTREEIKVQQSSLQRSLLKRVPDPGAPIRAVAEQRNRFEGELRSLDEQIGRIERESKFTFRVPGSPAFVDLVRAKAERVLLQEATDYTVQLHELLLSTQACRIQLLNADARMLAVRADIYKKLQELEEVNRAGGISLWNPFSDASRRRDAIEADLKRLTGEQTVATRQYDDKLKDCAKAKPKGRFTFIFGPDRSGTAATGARDRRIGAQGRSQRDWEIHATDRQRATCRALDRIRDIRRAHRYQSLCVFRCRAAGRSMSPAPTAPPHVRAGGGR
jgi:hypothetical protein